MYAPSSVKPIDFIIMAAVRAAGYIFPHHYGTLAIPIGFEKFRDSISNASLGLERGKAEAVCESIRAFKVWNADRGLRCIKISNPRFPLEMLMNLS